MTAPVDPIAVALRVTSALAELGIQHTVGGSIASSFAGEPRSTIDIDIVAAIDEAHVPALITALDGEFYVDDRSMLRAVGQPGCQALAIQCRVSRAQEASDTDTVDRGSRTPHQTPH